MLVFTIVMIVMYSILLIGTAVYKETYKKVDEIDKEDIAEQVIQLGIGCTFIIMAFSYLLTYVIYIFNALNVDSLVFPTYIMIALFVVNIIKTSIQMAFRKAMKIEYKIKKKTSPYSILVYIVTYVYFIYMLFILIVGS